MSEIKDINLLEERRSYAEKIRLYVEQDLKSGDPVVLDKDQSHYLGNVMRQKEGDRVLLFNGRAGEFRAEIETQTKKQVVMRVLDQVRAQVNVPDLWLVFAPIKRARLDFMVQKATELGVASIVPVFTARTNVSRVKDARMQANAIEAAEQTERLCLPSILEGQKLTQLLDQWPDDRVLIFCDELAADGTSPARPMLDAVADYIRSNPEKSKFAVLIGPEGGFSSDERKRLLALPHVLPVSLGPRILRADTAALSALSLWQAVAGDWQ